MTEFELLVDLHLGTGRQGPGRVRDTETALGLLDLPAGRRLAVADLGCGTGGSTLTLARHLDADITAVDLFPEFLAELEANARDAGLSGSIRTVAASIDALPFEPGSFDLVWSEGAVYNIGFRNGIRLWRDLLKPGGYLAVSEITWLTDKRPEELDRYWTAEYAEIAPASVKIRQLEEAGYTVAGYFPLPPESWIEGYYRPLEARFEAFLARHGHSEAAKGVVGQTRAEMDGFRRHSAYYSYGFYLARRPV